MHPLERGSCRTCPKPGLCMQGFARLAIGRRRWPCLRGARPQANRPLPFCRGSTGCTGGVTFSLLDSCTKGDRSQASLGEYLGLMWRNSYSSSFCCNSWQHKWNYKYKGLCLACNRCMVLWGKRSNGRTDRAVHPTPAWQATNTHNC